jgi:hypothetical protein
VNGLLQEREGINRGLKVVRQFPQYGRGIR